MFFYADVSSGSSGKINFDRLDPVKQFLKHYENSLFLKHYMSVGNFTERAQASKEMGICERKMQYWARNKNFVMDRALEGMSDLKKKLGSIGLTLK